MKINKKEAGIVYKDSGDGFQEDPLVDYNWCLKNKFKINVRQRKKKNYIIGSWRQLEFNLKTADFLQKNDC